MTRAPKKKKTRPAMLYYSPDLVAEVRQLLRKTQNEIKSSGKTAKVLNLETDLHFAHGRVRTLISPGQNAKKLFDHEIVAILRFAQKVASQSSDERFREYVEEAQQKITGHVNGALQYDLPSADKAAAIYRTLGVKAGSQGDFAADYAGDYLLFRRDSLARVIVSHLKIQPPAVEGDFLTFETVRETGGGPSTTTGVIYRDTRYMYALGHTVGVESIRLSILRPCNRLGSRDMAGLRLGVSALDDNAAFAHPLYCKRIEVKPGATVVPTGAYDDAESAEEALAKVFTRIPEVLSVLEKRVRVGRDKDKAALWMHGLGLTLGE